jgi:hypothetical protein
MTLDGLVGHPTDMLQVGKPLTIVSTDLIFEAFLD